MLKPVDHLGRALGSKAKVHYRIAPRLAPCGRRGGYLGDAAYFRRAYLSGDACGECARAIEWVLSYAEDAANIIRGAARDAESAGLPAFARHIEGVAAQVEELRWEAPLWAPIPSEQSESAVAIAVAAAWGINTGGARRNE